MRFMPDSAILGTIGHAKRRSAKSKARARRASRNQRPLTGVDIIGGIALMFGFILFVALFV
jgi:hypothetical protein